MTVPDMIKTLKGVITNMSGNDQIMMSYCLELNDDLMKVVIIFNNIHSIYDLDF